MVISDSDKTEIEEARQNTNPTRRPTVAAVEEILFEPLPVLDHGFVRVVDYMGDDTSVVQAARVSYGRGTRKELNRSYALVGASRSGDAWRPSFTRIRSPC